MTDKEKFRKEVEKLKSQLLRGACSSQIAMETRCKEEAYNDMLAILDTMQEKPVSKNYRERYKRIAQSEKFKKIYEGMSVGEIMHVEGEEPVSEDLEEASKNYALNNTPWDDCKDEIQESFKDGAKWQKEKDDEEKVLTYRHGFNDCKEHINEALLSEVLPCFMHGGEADEVVAKLDEILNQKK